MARRPSLNPTRGLTAVGVIETGTVIGIEIGVDLTVVISAKDADSVNLEVAAMVDVMIVALILATIKDETNGQISALAIVGHAPQNLTGDRNQSQSPSRNHPGSQ